MIYGILWTDTENGASALCEAYSNGFIYEFGQKETMERQAQRLNDEAAEYCWHSRYKVVPLPFVQKWYIH